MAFRPASGAIDLNPQQVEINHLLTNKLASVYRLWGYEEVSPPRVERLLTLTAAGAIASRDIVKLVSDEPLGLRPELTASIARAACTRLSQRPRPLRLWASGTVFESRESPESGLIIEENLQSGIELFGIKGIEAERELLYILLQAHRQLALPESLRPTLLIGHTSLMELILKPFDPSYRERIKDCLTNYNLIQLRDLDIETSEKELLMQIQSSRGIPTNVLNYLQKHYGMKSQ